MYFINRIIGYFSDASDFFYDAGLTAYDWVWPFWYLGGPMFDLSDIFAKLAWRFVDFGELIDDIVDEIADILSWSNIRSLIRSWLPDLEDVVDWWDRWWLWIRAEIDLWWNVQKTTVQGWLANLEIWTITEINNAIENITQVISNIYDYSQTIINNITEYITQFITNIYDYSQTTINNITEYITQFITNIYDYSITTINNITEYITQVIDWSIVYSFLENWWDSKLKDLELLVESWLKLWFPFYNELSELWSSIAEFFTDPEEWLYKAFDRIIERFW